MNQLTGRNANNSSNNIIIPDNRTDTKGILTSLMDDKSVISMNNNINNDNNFNIENNEWNERMFATFFILSAIYSILKFIYNSFWNFLLIIIKIKIYI